MFAFFLFKVHRNLCQRIREYSRPENPGCGLLARTVTQFSHCGWNCQVSMLDFGQHCYCSEVFYRGVKISITIARFYLTVKHEAEDKLTDGTGHKPHYRSVSIQFLINNLKVKLLLCMCFTWNLLISQPFKSVQFINVLTVQVITVLRTIDPQVRITACSVMLLSIIIALLQCSPFPIIMSLLYWTLLFSFFFQFANSVPCFEICSYKSPSECSEVYL